MVTTNTDVSDPYDGHTSLREALAYAATLGGSQAITFDPSVTGTITLGSGLTISSDVTITGPGTTVLTVSGGGGRPASVSSP